ncbi:glycosyltransferase family 4 protein [Balneolaceae bacterium YR4-1]|uniref:Glycosyltransferase family 4 protein n=1 Tax=Halalkalibaculum roseum TaxID=2709311 RepID=A0A6M1SXH6_9BACT|nr:glycosyltransferase family 4 protein [Halalkalibaculum roseum]
MEKDFNPDVVFTTSGPAYWRPNAPHLVGYNLPHYIYKDSPFFSQIPLQKQLKWYFKGRVLKYFFKKEADAYVVQTDDVNRRLQQWLDTDKVYTVSNTVSRHYNQPKKIANKLPKKNKDEFRFLILSSWHAHKNLDIIPDVIKSLPKRLKQKVRFVLTLSEDTYWNKFPIGISDAIINIGPVKPDEGPALYKECDALFLPTLLECFSATYAEAMKMNKPIITSDLGFAHTVCGDAAIYFNPINPKDIASKITQLIEQPTLQEKLIKEGMEQQENFVTAKERAEQYLKICKNLVDAEKN